MFLNFERYKNSLNESLLLEGKELENEMSRISINLSNESKDFINTKSEEIHRDTINSIKNSNWIITVYPGVIKVRNSSGGKEETYLGNTKDFKNNINKVKNGIVKNKYQQGLLLVFYCLLYGLEGSLVFNPKDSLKKERIALDNLSNKLREVENELGNFELVIKTSSGVITWPYYSIDPIEAKDVPGTPKADFVILDENGNHLYISHKDGSGVTGFQQYSGMSGDKNIASHPEVQNFVNVIKDKIGSMKKMTKGTFFAKPIEDEKLMGYCIFGNDYGSKNFGINNCQVMLQGEVILQISEKPKGGNVVTIESSSHSLVNPYVIGKTKLVIKDNDPYKPAMFCAKSAQLKQFNVPGARFYVWPQGNPVVKKGSDLYKKLLDEYKK